MNIQEYHLMPGNTEHYNRINHDPILHIFRLTKITVMEAWNLEHTDESEIKYLIQEFPRILIL